MSPAAVDDEYYASIEVSLAEADGGRMGNQRSRVESPGRKGMSEAKALEEILERLGLLNDQVELLVDQHELFKDKLAGVEEKLLATFQEAKDAVKALDAKVDALIAKVGETENPEHQAAFDEIKADADALGAKLDGAVNPQPVV